MAQNKDKSSNNPDRMFISYLFMNISRIMKLNLKYSRIKVVADQVAVALSHAAVLEESQLMREKLEEQNQVLQQAKRDAMMASRARNSFQKVMNDGMRKPMHTILGLLSLLREGRSLSPEQRTIVDSMARTGNVLSILINDAMDIREKVIC